MKGNNIIMDQNNSNNTTSSVQRKRKSNSDLFLSKIGTLSSQVDSLCTTLSKMETAEFDELKETLIDLGAEKKSSISPIKKKMTSAILNMSDKHVKDLWDYHAMVNKIRSESSSVSS